MYYVLQIEGDVEPVLHGPYATEEERAAAARNVRRKCERDNVPDGIYWLTCTGAIEVGAYTGGFFNADFAEE